MIYDEQSPLAPPSRSAFTFEEPPVPAAADSLTRAQRWEKAGGLRDAAPEKKSTFNQSDLKLQPPLQKNVSKRDPPTSHGHSDKKNLLKVENGVTQRDRSASPRKSASRYGEERSEKIPSPLKSDPKRRPRDRSPSPRKGERESGQSSARSAAGQDPARRGRGRSSSPKRPGGNGERPGAGAQLPESEREKPGGAWRETQQSQPGKNRTASPEKQSKRTGDKLPPSTRASNVASRASESKGNRAPAGETSSSKARTGESVRTSERKLKPDPEERVLNKTEGDEKEREAADKGRGGSGPRPEPGSPARKTPITPGPWKVPSASKATGTTSVAEKRL